MQLSCPVRASYSAIPPGQGAVLITGGRAGIGRACAEALSKKGWTVLVTVRKQADAEALQKDSPSLVPVVFDVTKEEQGAAAREQVEALLRERSLKLAAVVANAGINPEAQAYEERAARGEPQPNELCPLALAEETFATNVLGVVRTARLFLPGLRAAGGRLVIIGSYFGSMSGAMGLSHIYYESTKFACEGLADGLRRSLRREGVSVSLVKPGNISTGMNTKAGEDGPGVVCEAVEAAIISLRPQTRYCVGRVRGTPTWLLCRVFELLPAWLTDRLL